MFINCLFLAVSSSIDSLGIGVTYGIKNTKISTFSKFILLFISFLVSLTSVFFGDFLSSVLPKCFNDFIGCFFLLIIGGSILIKSVLDHNSFDNNCFDFNNSNLIDPKEAVALGFALSLDSFGIGVSSSLIGSSSLIFPFLISFFQFVFLSLGIFLGTKLHKVSLFPDSIWSFVSGLLLVCIALFRLVFSL